jgi:hypothetical protein
VVTAERNYRQELQEAGKTPEGFLEYIKSLSIDEFREMGRQEAQEEEERMRKGEVTKESAKNSTIGGLGFLFGMFYHYGHPSEEEIYKLFLTILDKNEPLYWRYTLVALLDEIKVKEWDDINIRKEDEPHHVVFSKEKWFSLVDALHKILLSSDEDPDLRWWACRTVTGLLKGEHGGGYGNQSDSKKINDKDFTQRIQENISDLQKILKDTKEPSTLREETGKALKGWHYIGTKCFREGWGYVDVLQPEQIRTDILGMLNDKQTYDLETRILIASSAYLQDESFIPLLEDLLTEVKDKDNQKKIKKILREIKRGCEEEK